MSELPDGTVLQNSSNLRAEPQFNLAAPQKAIIREVFYTDDEDNPGQDCVRAKVEIISDDRHVRIPPVRIAYARQGIENCQEWNPRPSKCRVDGEAFVKDTITDSEGNTEKEKTEPDLLDGDVVIVQFMNMNPYDGYITGFIAHGKENGGDRAAKKEDGDRYLFQHQGLRVKVDKEGNYLLETFQSQLPEFKDKGNQKRKIIIKNYDNESKGQQIELDGVANEMTITKKGDFDTILKWDASSSELKVKDTIVKVDGAADTISHTLSDGSKLDLKPDDVSLQTAGGDKLSLKGGEATLENSDGSKAALSMADGEFKGKTNTDVGGSGITAIKGSMVLLGGGGLSVARVSDQVISMVPPGIPAIGNIVTGSTKVTSA